MPARENTAVRLVPIDIYNGLWDTADLYESVNIKALDKNDDLKWMNKDQITDLQTQLIEAGYLQDRKNTDGTYAEADGKIGKKTREALDRYINDRFGENQDYDKPPTISQTQKDSSNITLSDKLYDNIGTANKGVNLIKQIGDHLIN